MKQGRSVWLPPPTPATDPATAPPGSTYDGYMRDGRTGVLSHLSLTVTVAAKSPPPPPSQPPPSSPPCEDVDDEASKDEAGGCGEEEEAARGSPRHFFVVWLRALAVLCSAAMYAAKRIAQRSFGVYLCTCYRKRARVAAGKC